jgi:hypothetical protein
MTICLGILLFDFATACIFIVMGLSYLIDGEALPLSRWYCNFNDLIYAGGILLSIWYVGLMNFERGLKIIHGISLSKNVWIAIMVAELLYFLVINIICFVNNDIRLVHLGIYCMAAPERAFGKVILCSYFILLFASVLITIYSYIGITIILRKRAIELYYTLNIDKEIAIRRANRTTIKVLVLLLSYLILNGLETINMMIEVITGLNRNPVSDFISNCLLNLNPIFNSILLIQLHDPVKASFIETYPLLSKITYITELTERNTA